MRKINLLLVSLLVLASGFFTSCEKDEDTGFDTPSVEVKYSENGGTSQSIQDGATIEKAEGTVLKFDVKFSMGDAGDKLTKIVIKSEISNKVYTIVDSALNTGLFDGGDKSITYSYSTSIGSTAEKITFTTYDKQDREGIAIINLKPASVTPTGSVKTTEAILMGSWGNSTYGSCYSLDLNKVLTVSAGYSQQSAVDLFYYYGATNLATLAAPSASSVATIYNNANYGVQKWSTKNATKIYLYLTTPNFDGINDATTLTNTLPNFATAAGVGDYWNDLRKDDVLAIKTAAGKTAILKITELVTGSNGYIKLTIKTVQ